jgi:hypothetical protein
MQSSSFGTAPPLRSFRLQASAAGPSAMVGWLVVGVLLGTILTTTILVALLLLFTSLSPYGTSLLRGWNGGGYADLSLDDGAAPVDLPARVPLDPLVAADGDSTMAQPLSAAPVAAPATPDLLAAAGPAAPDLLATTSPSTPGAGAAPLAAAAGGIAPAAVDAAVEAAIAGPSVEAAVP